MSERFVKHCPHCFATIVFRGEIKDGKCWKCEREFVVVHRLRKVCIEKPFQKRDYEGEILNFIKLNGKTYAAEIGKSINISRTKVAYVLDDLVRNEVLVEDRRKYRWVDINS